MLGLKDFQSASKLCQNHLDSYLKLYTVNQKFCFDPDRKHMTRISKNLREVTMDVAKQLKAKMKMNVIPGMKYCDSCRKSLQTKLHEFDLASEISNSDCLPESSDAQIPSQTSFSYSNTDSQVCKDQIVDVFDQLHLDHINLDGQRQESKASYLKRKMEEVTNVMCIRRHKRKSIRL